GMVVFKLFDEVIPLTARNFRELAIGNQGYGYEGSFFSRVVPQILIQGGDCDVEDGRGGKSIFGGEFHDKNFVKTHNKAGVVSMVNFGKDSNASQFFIYMDANQFLDGSNVVFGQSCLVTLIILLTASLFFTPTLLPNNFPIRRKLDSFQLP
ncbi:hypothetical protein PILCRDRAFT_82839, partial [Piloderma croceum F 1598]